MKKKVDVSVLCQLYTIVRHITDLVSLSVSLCFLDDDNDDDFLLKRVILQDTIFIFKLQRIFKDKTELILPGKWIRIIRSSLKN